MPADVCMLMSFPSGMDGWNRRLIEWGNCVCCCCCVAAVCCGVAILVIPLRVYIYIYIYIYGIYVVIPRPTCPPACALGTRFNRRSPPGLKNIAVTKCNKHGRGTTHDPKQLQLKHITRRTSPQPPPQQRTTTTTTPPTTAQINIRTATISYHWCVRSKTIRQTVLHWTDEY